MNLDALIQHAKMHGFTHAAALNVPGISLLDEVRAMCQTNTCGSYGRCWICPPACGDLESCRARVNTYTQGLVVQLVGQLEDAFDIEAMQRISAQHKALFQSFAEELRDMVPRLTPLGSGSCQVCDVCTCPDAPCRFPEKAFPSMEAYGMLVSEVCKKNGLSYYYGPNTLAYTGCYLLGD